MADSKRLSILNDIQTTLRTMTTGGGYNYTVASESVSLDPTRNLLVEPEGDGPFYTIEPVPEGGYEYNPATQIIHTFRVNITGRHTSDSADPEDKATVWENMQADLEKVLAVDITRNALVVDTRMSGEPSQFLGVGTSIVLIVFPIEMRLHRTYGVP